MDGVRRQLSRAGPDLAYVSRSYPRFEAAPFWTGSAFAAAVGAALAMLRMSVDSCCRCWPAAP